MDPLPDPDPRSFREALRPTEHAKVNARALRRRLTPPERLLWSRLKNGQLNGLRFRKQHPVGPFIADFYCHQLRLVVEIDGPTHRDDQLAYDERRNRWMNDRGLRVIRITGTEVFRNLDGLLSTIARFANAPDHSSPAPAGEVPERSEGGGGSGARGGGDGPVPG
jgi:very-short-patch-repair endonuclease